MKIALCFYGQSRFVNKTFENVYTNLIEGNEVDVFAHSWKCFEYRGLIDKYDPVSFQVESQLNFNHHKIIPNTNYINVYPQIYSVSKVRELKINYELEKGFKYDVCIKIRPDIKLCNKINFSELDLDKLNVCRFKNTHGRWLDDNFSISNSEIFDRYYDMYNNHQHYFTEENKYKYNTTPEFFGEGAHLFFADYHNVFNLVNKTHQLDFNIQR